MRNFNWNKLSQDGQEAILLSAIYGLKELKKCEARNALEIVAYREVSKLIKQSLLDIGLSESEIEEEKIKDEK